MEPIQEQTTNAAGINQPLMRRGINTKLDRILEALSEKESDQKDSGPKKWKFPFKWKRTMNKSLKHSKQEKILCFFINLKGELETPVLLPIHNGNVIIYKFTIHEVDPRDIITLSHKRKTYKMLIYNIHDRKAFSPRNYGEVKERGDSTMDDEVFIKAILTAKASQVSTQQLGKGALIIGGLVIAALVIWFFFKK